MPPTQKLFDNQGRPVQLGPELGRGGEGSVFALGSHPAYVAKLYHTTPAVEKGEKLELMVRFQSQKLLSFAAWPIATLHEQAADAPVGIVMPRVAGFSEIHTLYSPKTRLAQFTSANWPFLIHTATNIARAFGTIHEHGHVIGDVNHGNIVVNPQGIIKLIDCDSFQLRYGDRQFLCDVGISTHTPPELQGHSFRGVLRTPNHDAFGMAVLIFQLLFMGRHPFSGRYLGPGEMSLEKAITEFRFAYGPGAAGRQMQQPPATLPLDAVSPDAAGLFEKAFSPSGSGAMGRPVPRDWTQALQHLSQSLARCSQSDAHHYWKELPACPWCEIEARSGAVLFAVVVTALAGQAFNLDAIWARIAAISPPGPPPPLPVPHTTSMPPSPGAIELATQRQQRGGIALIFLLVVSVPLLATLGGAAIFLIGGLAIAASKVVHLGIDARKDEFRQAREDANRQVITLSQRWHTGASESPFQAKLRQLEEVRKEYLDLPSQRQRQLQQLNIEREQRQRQRFLDQHRIDSAKIPGLGVGRKATLQSYGIETAADIVENLILQVPGFGPSLATRLMQWRQAVERNFRFDPNRGVDPADIAAIDHQIDVRRVSLERALIQGPAELQEIRRQILATRETVKPALQQALFAQSRAEVDAKALRIR